MKHNFLDLMGGNGKKPSRWALPIFLGIGLLLGAALAAAVILWLVPALTTKTVAPATEIVPEEEPIQEEKEDILSPTWQEAVFNGTEEVYSINASWLKDARELTASESRTVLRASVVGTLEEAEVDRAFRVLTSEEEELSLYDTDEYGDSYTWDFVGVWEVGEVQSAPWKGAVIYHLRLNVAEMGGGYRHIYLIRPQDGSSDAYGVGASPTGVSADEPMADLLQGITFLPNASFVGLEMPEEIVLENGKKLVKDEENWFESESYQFDEGSSLRQVARTRDGQPVYEYREQSADNNAGCLYIFAPDGKRITYRSVLNHKPPRESYAGIADAVVTYVQWDTKYQAASNAEYLERLYGGCGGYACTAIVSDQEARAGGGLTRIGTTIDGDPVYLPTRLENHPTVKELYDGWYIPDGKSKPSITEMLKQYPVPVFYWQDALGRWVEYRTLGILPMAECGKPVIYLYPEKTTDVSVRLPSFIDVTVSDPTYPEKGWVVTAQPNGQLMSHADGKTYGSLYWEGTGVGYAPPTEGFVVKDGEVAKFLRDVLPKYGLNETEAREFMEFWLPEMKGAPYYRISFLTSAWSSAAPLYVSPRPQTNIRIFMDWKPMSAPISLPEPEIVTPERNGFTLVEWGGTLWK